MSAPVCECDLGQRDNCPAEEEHEAERAFWARYFGQTADRTPQQRREVLESMRPTGLRLESDDPAVAL